MNFWYLFCLLKVFSLTAEDTLEYVGESIRDTNPILPRQDTGLFSAKTRPEAVQRLYLKADLAPRAEYAALGPLGWRSAKKFCLTPVLKHPGETVVTLPKSQVRKAFWAPHTWVKDQ